MAMPIKPIDFQALLPKASEVTQKNSNLQFKNNTYITEQFNKTNMQSRLETKTVNEKEKAQEVAIQVNGPEKRDYGKQKRKKKDKKPALKDNKDKEGTSRIDIRL